MAGSILPKATTFAQWVRHPLTATAIFAFGLSTTLLALVVSGNNARVNDCKEQIALWHNAYDTIVKMKAQSDQQIFLLRLLNEELIGKTDSLGREKIKAKLNE